MWAWSAVSLVFLATFVSTASALLVDESFAQLENNGPEAWQEQLQSMDDQSAPLLSSLVGRSDLSWSPSKGRKNRYANVQPYTWNRVRLAPFPDEDNATSSYTDDYINASEMKLPKANRWYIMTQAPLGTTVGDFWRLIYQQKVKNIVMLCHKEGGSCAVHYWPTPSRPMVDNGATRAVLLDRLDLPDMTITRIQLSRGNETPHNVTHYHYLGWKDMQIPPMQSFQTFLHRVQLALGDTSSPSAVHCTAGVGRSGTFVLIDSTLAMIRNGYDVDILEQLKNLRQLRYGLVETPEQLRFTYEAIIAAGNFMGKQ